MRLRSIGVGVAVLLALGASAQAGDQDDLSWDPYFQVKDALVKEGYRCDARSNGSGHLCQPRKNQKLPIALLTTNVAATPNGPNFRSAILSTEEACEPNGVEGVLIYGLMTLGWECTPQTNGWICEGETHTYKLGLHVLAPESGGASEKCIIQFNSLRD